MNLDALTVLTYVCAGLGVILLLLCIILAVFIAYGFCKKNCKRRQVQSYSVVPNTGDPFDLENAVLNRYHINNDAAKGLSGLQIIDEVDPGVTDTMQRNAAPVNRKIFWKKKKNQKSCITSEDSKFSQEELEAGRPKRFFKKRKQASLSSRKMSKSDWYIYAGTAADVGNGLQSIDEEDEHQTLLYPHEVISLIGSPLRDDDLKQSQYFDALETIKEEIEDLAPVVTPIVSPVEDDQWTDVTDEENEIKVSKESQRRDKSRNANFTGVQMKKRIKALKRLQLESETIEAKFFRELFHLEAKFNAEKWKPLYEQRCQIVNDVDSYGGSSGIDNFWLHAMKNCECLSEIIQGHDIPVLKFLTDIRIESQVPTHCNDVEMCDEHLDFKIEFHFSEDNPFFPNRVLTKEYFLKCEPDPTLPFTFEGPEVINCKGCKIQWRKGKNVTLQPVKRVSKETGQLVTKFAKRNSFFNFFTPPKTVREWILDSRKASLMEAHFEIGLFFKETFVPKAVIYFASHSVKNLDGDVAKNSKRGYSNRGKHQSSRNKKQTSILKRPDSSNSHYSMGSEMSNKKSSSLDTTLVENHTSLTEGDSPGPRPRSWYQLRNGSVTEQLPSEAPGTPKLPEKDPIIGRYRLVSSEGFDDFMKALGVGIVKRKLANSVSPSIVVNVDSEGLYTIRTESHVTTSELNFQLGRPFQESTLDGRTVTTTPTRTGNTLILDQKGDPAKGDKDTRMIRDFRDRSMYLTMTVDDIVCKRVYDKV